MKPIDGFMSSYNRSARLLYFNKRAEPLSTSFDCGCRRDIGQTCDPAVRRLSFTPGHFLEA